MFWWGWQQGSATVVARRFLREVRSSHDGQRGMKRRKFEFILDVQADDGSPVFRATCKNWLDSVQGDVVPVKFKPKSKKVRFDTERMFLGGRRRKSQPKNDRWAAMVDEEPGTPPPPRHR